MVNSKPSNLPSSDPKLVAHSNVMNKLQSQGSEILDVVPSREVILVDFPDHKNIGDLLIHLGTEVFFAKHAHHVLAQFCINDLGRMNHHARRFVLGRRISELDSLINTGTILVFQGGGNFGDIWPGSQEMREELILRYPNNKIVILPQTVSFSSSKRHQLAMDTLKQHTDLHIFVRDEKSLEQISGLPNTYIAPDMAHQLWDEFSTIRSTSTRDGKLAQIRRDKERAQITHDEGFDWDDLISPTDKTIARLIEISKRIPISQSWHALRNQYWFAMRDRWIKSAVTKLSTTTHLTTDRLHGMILASLLGTPVHYHDNTYGKLSGYHTKWLQDSPLITRLPEPPRPTP